MSCSSQEFLDLPFPHYPVLLWWTQICITKPWVWSFDHNYRVHFYYFLTGYFAHILQTSYISHSKSQLKETRAKHFDGVCRKPFTLSTTIPVQTQGELLQTLPHNCSHRLSGRLKELSHISGNKQIIRLAWWPWLSQYKFDIVTEIQLWVTSIHFLMKTHFIMVVKAELKVQAEIKLTVKYQIP